MLSVCQIINHDDTACLIAHHGFPLMVKTIVVNDQQVDLFCTGKARQGLGGIGFLCYPEPCLVVIPVCIRQ